MRNTRLAALSLACALLAAGGCTSGDGKQDRTRRESQACTKLLGKEGMAWLKEHTTVPKLNPNTSETIAHARSKFRKQVPDWKPEETDIIRHTARSVMCDARNPKRGAAAEFTLAYSAAALPFDEFPGPNTMWTSVSLGPDAKLVYRKSRYLDLRKYYVYVRCGVPGASASQLNDVTLEGGMTDLLTDDLNSYRTHLQLLLHSAKVMADAFKCTNKPQIPANLPSSIKD
ncbi:hypothetical protein [Streptomyces sp. NPDC059063]|uniref:hypothetical protein n=1 Tax=unclassified Streptomyces TaxID=2593676 RepID=UPI0036BFDB6E